MKAQRPASGLSLGVLSWFLLLVPMLALLSPARADDEDDDRSDRRSVSVTGTAVTRVAPDIVVWQVGTIDTDPNLLQAKRKSDEKAKRVLALRDPLQIKSEDLQSGHLRIQKIFQRDRQGNQLEFRHFEIRRGFTIRQRDVERFDEFLGLLVGGGDVEADFSFESSKFHELRNETRLKAIQIARDKARAMTEALDARLGPVLTIEEYQPEYFRPSPLSNSAFAAPSAEAPIDTDSGTLAPGAIEIRVSVVVRFQIE